jgi:uncharacterized membrane protein YidH (DUF202 family)
MGILSPNIMQGCTMTVGASVAAALTTFGFFNAITAEASNASGASEASKTNEMITNVIALEGVILIILAIISGIQVISEINNRRRVLLRALMIAYWVFCIIYTTVHSLLLYFFFEELKKFPFAVFGFLIYFAALCSSLCFIS